MSIAQGDFKYSGLVIGDDEDDDAYLDMVMENLSNMISPKNSSMTVDSNVSPPTSTTSTSHNAKISPLITDAESIQIVESATSLRGVDANNNPIYATSQTPYGFSAMTKRKTSKKSVFNFEGFELPEYKSSDVSSRDEQPSGIIPMAMDTPPDDSPQSVHRRYLRAKPRGFGTEASKQKTTKSKHNDLRMELQSSSMDISNSTGTKPKGLYGFDSMDETALKSNIEYFNEKEYLDALKWNVLSPSSQQPVIPTPKNPRKKADIRSGETNVPFSILDPHQQHALYMQQQQHLMASGISTNYPHQQQPGGQPAPITYPGQQQAYLGYYGQAGLNYGLNQASDALRAAWMNPSQSSQIPPRSDLTSQLQYYSGDISQLQLPSIRNAPPAVIPENVTYGFPLGYSGINSMIPGNGFIGQVSSGYSDSISSNISEMMSYQALLQRKMQELKQQTGGFDNSHAGNMHTASAATASAHDSDGEDGGKNSSSGGRASKSLSEISKRFVTTYGKDNTLDYIAGKVHPSEFSEVPINFNRVDAAAEQLGVHVRRIYELIKILEILSLVQFAGDKRGKFSWRGNKDFLRTLGEVQEDGLQAFPLMAAQSGLLQVGMEYVREKEPVVKMNSTSLSPGKDTVTGLRGALFLMEGGSNNSFDLLNFSEEETERDLATANNKNATSVPRGPFIVNTPSHHHSSNSNHHPHEEQFMVEIICKKFLQLFLVGMNYLSMSSAIQKLIPMEENQSLTDYNRINATKIRRVYDVTNVLCSLNLIRKQTISRKSAFDAEVYNNIDANSSGTSAIAVAVADHPVTAASMGAGSSGSIVKKGGKSGIGNGGGDRVDAKVLEWTSFNPAIIREQYLMMTRQV
jgi:hypothetical protein